MSRNYTNEIERLMNGEDDIERTQTTTVRNGGIGFVGLLQIVFITLKLCGVISWSWFWVLFPLILNAGLIVIVLLLALIVAIIEAIC